MVLLLVAGSLSVRAQHIAINNNLLFDVAGALSAGVEIPVQKSSTLEVYGSIRPWKRGEDRVHKHWTVQAQYRLWPCQVMNGFFWGPYVHGGQFNFGNEELFFGLLKGLKPNRYEVITRRKTSVRSLLPTSSGRFPSSCFGRRVFMPTRRTTVRWWSGRTSLS